MDEVAIVIGALGAASTAAGYWLGLRRSPSTGAPPIIDVEGTPTSPRGGHKHRWDTMLGDGKGWRCGVVVEPGVICGWVRDGEG